MVDLGGIYCTVLSARTSGMDWKGNLKREESEKGDQYSS
jgi:hypothetical protein